MHSQYGPPPTVMPCTPLYPHTAMHRLEGTPSCYLDSRFCCLGGYYGGIRPTAGRSNSLMNPNIKPIQYPDTYVFRKALNDYLERKNVNIEALRNNKRYEKYKTSIEAETNIESLQGDLRLCQFVVNDNTMNDEDSLFNAFSQGLILVERLENLRGE